MQLKLNQYITLGVLSLTVATICYFGFNGEPVEAPKPYDNMITVLTTDGLNNKQRFDGLFYEYFQITKIDGWRVKAIRLKGIYSMYFMEKTNGDSRNILQWPDKNRYELIVDKQGTTLLSAVPLVPPLKQIQIMDINQLALYVEDLVSHVMPATKIAYLEDIKQSDHSERPMTLELNGTSLLNLQELGTLLDGLPVAFSQAELLNNQSNQLTGEINLILFGV